MKEYYSEDLLKFDVSGTTYTLKRINGDYSVYKVNDGELIKVNVNIPDWQDPEYTGKRPPFEELPIANNITDTLLVVLEGVIEAVGGSVKEVKGKAVTTEGD